MIHTGTFSSPSIAYFHLTLWCSLRLEAEDWPADDRSLLVGTGPRSAAYNAYGAPFRLLPERKVYVFEYCLETGLIVPPEVGGWDAPVLRGSGA